MVKWINCFKQGVKGIYDSKIWKNIRKWLGEKKSCSSSKVNVHERK